MFNCRLVGLSYAVVTVHNLLETLQNGDLSNWFKLQTVALPSRFFLKYDSKTTFFATSNVSIYCLSFCRKWLDFFYWSHQTLLYQDFSVSVRMNNLADWQMDAQSCSLRVAAQCHRHKFSWKQRMDCVTLRACLLNWQKTFGKYILLK